MGSMGMIRMGVQLELTNQLFDVVLGGLAVVGRGQPVLMVGDFNVEPTVPCLSKRDLG